MTSPADIISSIYYVSPYANLPPGRRTAGLTVNVNQASVPTTPPNLVLVTRLRLANETMVIGVSATSGPGTSPIYALYQPSFPLSATTSYLVDLIWVPQGTAPDGIAWSEAVATAPVIAASMKVASASFDGQNVTALLDYGPGSSQTGAQLLVYGYSAGVWALAGSANVEGSTATASIEGYPAPYRIYATALIPAVNPGGAGSFAAPFSQGPFSPPQTVPQAAASLTQADYDGAAVSLAWALDGIQGAPLPQSSQVSVQVDGAEIAAFTGGPTSASFGVAIGAASGVTARVQTLALAIRAAPLSIPLITAAPTVSIVAINGSTVETAVATSAAASEGWLMRGDEIVAGPAAATSGKLSFNYAASGAVGLTVVARGKSSDGKTTGPRSQPATLLATAPVPVAVAVQTDPSNSTNWQIACQWAALPDSPSSVASYTVSILQSGSNTPLATQTTSGTTATLSVAKSAITQGATQTLSLQATSTSGGASPAASQALAFVTPALTAITTTPDHLAVAWSAPTGLPATPPPRYAIRILNGGGAGVNQLLLLGSPTTGTAAAVPLADLSVPAGGSAVAMVDLLLGPVRVVADRSMAAGQQTTAILAAPRIAAATTNPATKAATLNWADAAAGLTYALQFSDGTRPSSSTTSYTLASQASVGLRYQVAATQTTNGVVVTGPYSASMPVPTAADTLVVARYDGTAVTATWDAHCGADSHVLSIYDNATTSAPVASATLSGTAGLLAFTADPSKTYSVYVQPITADGTGLSANAMLLFAPAFFLSQQPATSAAPYAYPATAQANLGSSAANPPAQEITLYLPQLGLTPDALGSNPIVSGPFTVAASGDAKLPYKLTIAANAAVWSFDTTSFRPTLQADYVQLLTSLESPGAGLAGASPYGIYLVQSAIARMMPQTFDEQLYYNFGLSLSTSAGSAYVDLRPGMVLRVVLSDYVSINEQSLPTWLNGYAGATLFDFEIGSYQTNGAWRVGFDGFLNQLAAHNALQVSAPFKSTSGAGQSGVAAAADLYYPQFQQAYYRAFVPATLLSPSSTTNANQVNLNFAIVAAASFATINNATPNPQQYATAYFRGRSTLEAMIRVRVDGGERLVPVGTSLGNLLEQLQRRPNAAGRSGGLRLLRASGPGQTATSAAASLAGQLEVTLDWQGGVVYAAGTGYDGYSLPLLAGDQVLTAGF
jgi:hypothetical protein